MCEIREVKVGRALLLISVPTHHLVSQLRLNGHERVEATYSSSED